MSPPIFRPRWRSGFYALPAVIAGIFLLSGSAAAATGPIRSAPAEREIARCIQSASAGKSWLEKTLWGLRDQEAGWIGAEVFNTNGTHDLGPLQVNSSWVPKFAALTGRSERSVRYWLINDPCFNVQAARWLFLAALRTTGDYWKAVGVYHSPTAWRQHRYASSVATKLRERYGLAVFD
ncbi:lytic transglycosylase domain-containing protein [Sphingobium sp. CCH11-B1]|uniref:lytic transglycosylase domain-containing protein n=1 Tax=Sphingobium sp. CCH11-B1 TaxID=1768781 RepID=UPI000A97547A|nr:lytic transglycosylase domain-containing protein [Sphingobium sp. CCH11-B1]